MLPEVLPTDIEADFAKAPFARMEYYFVNVNDANPDAEEEAASWNQA